jgi:hypothetical protein
MPFQLFSVINSYLDTGNLKRGQKGSLEKVSSLKRVKDNLSYCSTSSPAISQSASIGNTGI